MTITTGFPANASGTVAPDMVRPERPCRDAGDAAEALMPARREERMPVSKRAPGAAIGIRGVLTTARAPPPARRGDSIASRRSIRRVGSPEC